MINVRIQNQANRLKPKITVIGVGGAGGNAVNNMIHSNLEGCEFLVCNTDAQAIEGNSAGHKIQLGVNVTRGLGAGANPEIGRAAAEESLEEILAYLEGANMVFVTAGMGGGTGTGAAPVIAQAAREAGILTVGVVTKPFHFEGTHRMKLAENGIAELQRHVDTLIIIPNQNLFRIANEKTTFADAFRMADEVLQSGVRGVTDLMVMPGLINLDFADIRAVMAEMGKAMMGTGEAEGDRRAVEAAEAAISNPLLDDVSMKGAKGVLINITGGNDMTLFEVDEAANRIRDEVDPDANIIFGSTFDQTLEGRMRVSVVATGIDAVANNQARPLHLMQQTQGEPVRRPASSGMARAQHSPSAGGYTGFERSQGQGGQGRTSDFSQNSLPASIIPSQPVAGRPMASAMAQPASAMAQPASAMTQPATMQKTGMTTAGGDAWDSSPEQDQQTFGHAASVPAYTGAATARKLSESEAETATWTRSSQPPATQNYQRMVPSPIAASTAQPRAARLGDSFIPPKPVDPRAPVTSSAADLFGAQEMTAPVKEAPHKPAKKSPSIFERFTSQRDKDAPAAAPVRSEVSSKLSVEEGGKKDEDDIDIPAFLRRQAN
jgi:cell division protein FtsZ